MAERGEFAWGDNFEAIDVADTAPQDVRLRWPPAGAHAFVHAMVLHLRRSRQKEKECSLI